MKIFANKNIVQKVIIAIVIVLLFNFIVPNYSHAGIGGVLMGPIIDFISAVGDAVLSALQFFFYDGGIDLGGTMDITKGFNQFTLAGSLVKDTIKSGNQDYINMLKQYGLQLTNEEPDIIIDSDKFDKGWRNFFTFGFLEKDYGVPIIKYSPEAIFSNEVPSLDVNFINPKQWNNEAMDNRSVTKALHSTIANWYIALRNLSIVALLSILLYVGIRMVISSTASDKSKYKQMLIDWIVALCIVFFLHYLMSFILTVTDMITQGLAASSEITVQIKDGDQPITFNTDLIGVCRIQVQYADLGARLTYLILYIALVIYTVMFTWIYVKRAILMAFLTLIAPLVAITYPIDKISDGKAQAYGMWLKEFIFNALLQPFHLIIYTVFLGSSIEIAVENPIYAILFLAFIIPAEKILRKMFGFENASTAGSFAAGFGGAAAFKALSGAIGRGKKGSGNGNAGKDRIRTKNPVKDKNEIGKDFSAFSQKNKNGLKHDEANASLTDKENKEMSSLKEELDNADYNDMYLNPGAYQAKQDRLSELERKQAQSQEKTRNKEQKKPKSFIRGAKNIAVSGAKYTGKKLKHRFASVEGWKQNAKFAGRMAVRGAGAVTFGAVGIGMGMAGSDLEDVLQLGAAGAVLGGTVVGGRLADAGGRLMHNANIAFQEGYYGDRNAALMAQQYNEYYNNEEKREFFGEEFEVEGKELDNIMARAADINNQGITDNKAVKQTIKLEDSIMKELKDDKNLNMSDEEKTKAAHEQALTIAKVADYFDTGKLMTSEKYRQGVYEHFENGLKKVNPEMSQKDIDIQKENMMKLLKKYKKID